MSGCGGRGERVNRCRCAVEGSTSARPPRTPARRGGAAVEGRQIDMTGADVAPPVTPPPITVVIVDDHLLVADSIAAALNATSDITVLDIAGTCADGVAAVELHQPDILLLDQRLPNGLGTAILPRMLEVS